ncbi:MAG: cyclic nucleotide-binding domain-containing protein [Actinomycetota bacterium]
MNGTTHTLVKTLRRVPDFAGLPEHTLLAAVGASANLVWRGGERIFDRGEAGEALYIVLTGEVRILGEDDAEVARIGAGDYFGELSLLLHTTHSKAAEAVSETELMVIPKASFQELLEGSPELATHFRRKVERRLPIPEPPPDPSPT